MEDNKYLWICAGLLAGYLIAKYLCKCNASLPIDKPDTLTN